MQRNLFLAPFVLAALAGAAHAHPNHDADAPRTPPKARAASGYSTEVVARDGVGTVYVTRQGAKVPTAGAMGILTVQGAGGRTEMALQPAGENAMRTREKSSLKPGTRASVSISLADRSTVDAEVTVR